MGEGREGREKEKKEEEKEGRGGEVITKKSEHKYKVREPGLVLAKINIPREEKLV